MADTKKQQQTIAASPEKVLAVLRDFAAYSEWQREVKESEVLEVDGDKRPVRARLVMVNPMGVEIGAVLSVEHGDNELKWALAESELMTRYDVTYQLTDLGNGSTDLSLELGLAVNMPVPADMVDMMMEQRVTDTLKEVKAAAES